MLSYPLPKGSKTIQLYQNYSNYFNKLQSVGLSDDVSMEDFLTSDEIKVNYNKFMEENESYSLIDSILLTGIYYKQLPLDLYDILYVGGDTHVSEPIRKEQQNDADTENIVGEESGNKTVDDPYFNALRNQSSNKFDMSTINLLENDSTDNAINYKSIYQNICLIVFSVGTIVALILYFLNKTRGR